MNRRKFIKQATAATSMGTVMGLSGCTGSAAEEALEIRSHRMARGQYGNLYVVGQAVNTGDKPMSYASVEVVFLDSSGSQLESGMDNINNLAAGRSWNFEAIYPGMDGNRVYNYEIQPGASF
ncbi:hypothetical protein HWV07_09170 [Natronomonas salina]|uniref:FxLYD domain-containing protein n=1 Tax=Natronomonas salina TaxID=1710540 RepID=UPI0015B51D03|nr:FxLYD domain-containing protein [Natronomonas salina]QLD89193.1 hypothetical protein HWV07_09170 [Natronomonas salina]